MTMKSASISKPSPASTNSIPYDPLKAQCVVDRIFILDSGLISLGLSSPNSKKFALMGQLHYGEFWAIRDSFVGKKEFLASSMTP
jgi:hypothetical protein